MAQISISNLTFRYEGSYDNIFEDVSFCIDTDWRLGFTGRNGRGKTTFLRLLTGTYEYSGGISAPVRFEYFPFEVDDMERDTMEVLRGICGAEDWRILRELNLLNVPADALYRPFRTLSNGERTKGLLAALFLKENGFLLIDEPTNHLDMEGRAAVAEYLKDKSGFILVSHDRDFLDGCVDHILSINKMDIEVQRGNFSTWFHNKKQRDQYELDENKRLKKDVKRLSEAARRTEGWSDEIEKTKIGTHSADRGAIGHKAAKMMKRAKSVGARRDKAAEEKQQLLRNIEGEEDLAIHPQRYHTERLVEVRDLAIAYDGKTVCSGVSFAVNRGDRVAITGGNGSGKSSILKMLLDRGEEMHYSGGLHVASGLKISYVPQDTAFLSGGLKDFAEERDIDMTLFLAILRKLDFPRAQFEKDMSDFSEGQKKKTLLAASLCERAHIYIWDEPLNFIDVLSRMQVERLIARYEPTMLFVEHDRAFVEGMATKRVVL